MTIKIDAPKNAHIARVTFSGELNRADIEARIGEFASQVRTEMIYLVDLTACALAMTASEFMSAVDFWFDQIGSAIRMALVFDPDAQKEMAMLFDTKSFLLGGRQKSFHDSSAAMSWLESWPRAAT